MHKHVDVHPIRYPRFSWKEIEDMKEDDLDNFHKVFKLLRKKDVEDPKYYNLHTLQVIFYTDLFNLHRILKESSTLDIETTEKMKLLEKYILDTYMIKQLGSLYLKINF